MPVSDLVRGRMTSDGCAHSRDEHESEWNFLTLFQPRDDARRYNGSSSNVDVGSQSSALSCLTLKAQPNRC
jgi:hypothetical protein